MEIEAHFATDDKNQSVCDNESVKEETLIIDTRTGGSTECSDMLQMNAANCSEINVENIFSSVSVGGNSTEKNKENHEETMDI